MVKAKSSCRFCSKQLNHTFADLGMSPLANSYLKEEQLLGMEPFFPLHVYVCEKCHLVQLPEFQSPENIFDDYAYFSSYSDSWLKHAKDYTESMIQRFGFDTNSAIVEIASNDGYLLQYFKEKAIPVLGIEPAKNVAKELAKLGFNSVFIVQNGFSGWSQSKLQVRQSVRPCSPYPAPFLAHHLSCILFSLRTV